MDNHGKLILACAGSGKTTEIVRKCLLDLSTKIVVTYTIENFNSIKTKFVEINGCIPSYVTIYTWFSFLLKEIIRPYRNFLTPNRIKGVHLVQSISNKKVSPSGKEYWVSEEKNFENFFFDSERKVYTDMISKLAFRCFGVGDQLVITRLKLRADSFYFDEVQDLEGYDLEVLKTMMQNGINVFMVGDVRQKTYSTHRENKNSKYSLNIKQYMQDECAGLCDISDDELNTSHRCNYEIIHFASGIFPEFSPSSSDAIYGEDHQGLFYIYMDELPDYLRRFSPIQLRYSRKTEVDGSFSSLNFGDSKGLSFDRVVIFPTSPIIKWINNMAELAPKTKCKLYVAITRARYSVTFVLNRKDKISNASISRYIIQK